MKEKGILKGTIKAIIFVIICMFIVSIINSIFIIKTGHRAKLTEGLYKHIGDEYDVVLLGSSHMNSSINPNVLWNEYGITSFNYGTGGQPIDVTYYLLKEILKNHNNPIVVIDLYHLGNIWEFGQEGYIRYVLDNMKFSQNKIEAIINSTPKTQWAEYIFPIIKYHYRWKELTKEDFKFDTSESYYAKGFAAGTERYGKDNLSDLSTKEKAKLPSKSEKYLYKIIELSKKEGFKLVFINAPHDYTSTANAKNWHKDPAKMFNTVEKIVADNNIPFINYCNILDEIGFDFKADMFNNGHMNIWGSNKVTMHFGRFLKKNFNLTDHRKDKKYDQWNKDYNVYLEKQEQ